MMVNFMTGDLKKYNLKKFKQHLPVILMLLVFIINFISLGFNIENLQNPSTKYFTAGASTTLPNGNTFYYTNPNDGGIASELYSNFEIYNHSVITISGNQSVSYTFDDNFKSIISTKSFTFDYLKISNRFIDNRSYVFNHYTSRITTNGEKTFILGSYLENGSYGSYNLPEID